MVYSNYYLLPQLGIAQSRQGCDTTAVFGGRFRLPVVPSNMPAVINPELAIALAKRGYFYILHRFMPYDAVFNFVEDCTIRGVYSSISLGVKGQDYNLCSKLISAGLTPDYITVDVAHGHSLLVKDMVAYLKAVFPETWLIGGNVGTVRGVRDLQRWGFHAVKIGIGVADVCTTYPNTGFHRHPADLLGELRHTSDIDVMIIADGGVRTDGDIAKAIALGADLVMAGGLFAGHLESPGTVLDVDGQQYKWYFGNASEMRGNTKNIEGTSIHVPLKGSIFDTLTRIEQNLQSAISYAGGNKLKDLQVVDIAMC